MRVVRNDVFIQVELCRTWRDDRWFQGWESMWITASWKPVAFSTILYLGLPPMKWRMRSKNTDFWLFFYAKMLHNEIVYMYTYIYIHILYVYIYIYYIYIYIYIVLPKYFTGLLKNEFLPFRFFLSSSGFSSFVVFTIKILKHFSFLGGSFAIHPGDHLQTTLGIIRSLGIICGAVQNCMCINRPKKAIAFDADFQESLDKDVTICVKPKCQ